MIKVYIVEQRIGAGVDISIVSHGQHRDDVSAILRLDEHGYSSWEALRDESREVRPSFSLSSDQVRALHEALTQHFHGAEDTRALRKDYDHEKQRVDKMLDAFIASWEKPA